MTASAGRDDSVTSRWLSATAIVVFAILALPFVGYAIGKGMDNGIAALPPEEHAVGEAALRFASVMIGQPDRA